MKKRKIAILSNITVDMIAAKLHRKYEVYVPNGFDTWVQECINVSAAIYNDSFDCIYILLDGTEARNWKDIHEAEERFRIWGQAVKILVDRNSAVPIVVSTVDIRENRIRTVAERTCRYQMENEWYQFIQNIAEKHENVYVFDLKDKIMDIGRDSFYSEKMWYLSSMPFSKTGLDCICKEIDRFMRCAFEQRKKGIVLDLDNTLWGGVAGEDGVEGIELSNHKEGERFYDFQRCLKEMKERGAVLTIDSKNNESDVRAVLEQHPYMLLKEEDFAAKRINWQNKGTNLKEIARELNLSEEAFVFVDDNPAEREIVRGMCQETAVPEFPTDTTSLVQFAESVYTEYFQSLRLTDEDKRKTEQYLAESKRRQERSCSLNLEDYIERLEIQVDIHGIRKNEMERVAQLCKKTNQFNLTTKRYSYAELSEMASDSAFKIFTVRTRDKYDDNGLIGVLILKYERDCAYVDTFLMSCRVMGRKIEEAVINEIAAYCRADGYSKLVGEYVPTEKNVPVKCLYEQMGFAFESECEETKYYQLDIENYEKKALRYFQEILFEKENEG